MIVLVLGGSGSGKSSFAESVVDELAGNTKKMYLATMKVWDEELEKKVERHRRMRSGKGYETLEIPQGTTKQQREQLRGTTAILECMSNLTANYIFREEAVMEEYGKSGEKQKRKLITNLIQELEQCVQKIAGSCENLVIVSNNVFEDGITYDLQTECYIEILGSVNQYLGELADVVYEVVVSIPICLKSNV